MIALAAVGLVLAGCSQGGAVSGQAKGTKCNTDKSSVKIGAVLPLSGALAAGGQYGRGGYDLAARDINKAGGIKGLDGRCVEVVFGDHKGEPARASQMATQLVQRDKVVALSGSYTSATGLTASSAAQRLGVPWLQSVGLANEITERGLDLVFRNKYNTSMASAAAFELFKDLSEKSGKPMTRVALLWENSAYGTEAAKETRAAAKAAGVKLVTDIGFESGTANLTGQLVRVRGAKPDVVLAWDFEPDSIVLLKGMRTLGIDVPFVAPGGGLIGKGVADLGDVSNGVIALAGWSPDLKTPSSASVGRRFADKYGQSMNDDAAACYQATWILAEAASSAKSDKPADIAEALRTMNLDQGPATMVPTTDGKISFGKTGQSPSPALLGLQLIGGEFHTVWPAKYATQEVDLAAAKLK